MNLLDQLDQLDHIEAPRKQAENFWMVWREGGQRPREKHASYDSAKAECERIAQKHPGFNTYILHTVSCATVVEAPPPPVKWENLS